MAWGLLLHELSGCRRKPKSEQHQVCRSRTGTFLANAAEEDCESQMGILSSSLLSSSSATATAITMKITIKQNYYYFYFLLILFLAKTAIVS